MEGKIKSKFKQTKQTNSEEYSIHVKQHILQSYTEVKTNTVKTVNIK